MAYFLFKSEPDVYSFDDLLRDGETVWDGVTNPTAVKHLREMKPGTKWIFYHTGDERTAVGTGTVLSVDAADPKVPIVRVKAGKRLKRPKTLAQIKTEKLFARSPLLVIGRLSVVPLTQRAVGVVRRVNIYFCVLSVSRFCLRSRAIFSATLAIAASQFEGSGILGPVASNSSSCGAEIPLDTVADALTVVRFDHPFAAVLMPFKSTEST